MRTSIVAVFALAALCMGVTAFPRSLSKLTAKAAARETQSALCGNVLQQLKQCAASYATEEAALANCCSQASSLYGTCGYNLDNVLRNIMAESAGDFSKVRWALKIVLSCSNTQYSNYLVSGSESQCASAREATNTACATGSLAVSCCNSLTAQVTSCAGVSAVINDDAFWEPLLTTSSGIYCSLFAQDTCQAAASALKACITSHAPNGYSVEGYRSCCDINDYFNVFCSGQYSTVYSFDVSDALASDMDLVCSMPQCNPARVAPGFHMYYERVTNPMTGQPITSSRIVTSKLEYALGFGPGAYPIASFTDPVSGTAFYEVDWMRLPVDLQFKLQSRDARCPATSMYPPAQ